MADLAPAFTDAGSVAVVAAASHVLLASKGYIYRSDGTHPASFGTVAAGDEVWIVGHGAANIKVMKGDGKPTLDQSAIVNRLVVCGLPTGIACKIVIYACESGKGLTVKNGTKTKNDSLAAMVASALAVNKPNAFACATDVWGFLYQVVTKASGGELKAKTGDGEWKKFADLTELGIEFMITRLPNVY